MTIRKGLILFAVVAVVHNLLRLIAGEGGAPWGIFNYLQPFHVPLDKFSLVNLGFAAVAAGLVLTVAWGQWDGPSTPLAQPSPVVSSVFWTVPTAALAGLFAVMVSSKADIRYGWVMFALIPFLTGFQATLALSRKIPIRRRDAISVSILSSLLLGGLLLAGAVEGIICLIMAAPLALILAISGGLLGYWVCRLRGANSPITFVLIVGLTPLGGTMERALLPPASVFQVVTSVDIETTPERVWKTVLQPTTLAPPTQFLLRAGVGYPLASHIEGFGNSAIRYCDFSTGKLVEPVEVWDEPRELRFGVVENPIPMQEWTPYAHLHPPHLDGFLVTRQGRFRLIPLANGGTRLEATTWYQHHLWPEQYWRWWSDDIIHGIHRMVLEDIRDRALRGGEFSNGPSLLPAARGSGPLAP